jgi:hypothetical protein
MRGIDPRKAQGYLTLGDIAAEVKARAAKAEAERLKAEAAEAEALKKCQREPPQVVYRVEPKYSEEVRKAGIPEQLF